MAVVTSTLKLTLLDQISGRAKHITGVLNGLERQATMMSGTVRGLLAFGAGYLGVTQGIDSTVGAALSFESAFANVKKVIGGTDAQMEAMRRTIINMSKTLPISAEGIAAIYAAAGASNIPANEMDKFAEMVAKVSTAWEVPVAETGQALAEIKNQLHMGVGDLGLFADAINYLDNTTAANAPKLLEFTKRVAATGEMFGFTATQSLAFGGAMIASGAESEVAATSFRNMGKALTIGTRATKSQKDAFKRLGLDSVKTAKNMQKNALGTTQDVLQKIAKLPEWERISIASALFGDEARALMPVINNSTELQRQLGLVGDKANYAGSAFQEYIVRASTVGNVLEITKNKFADLFRGIGNDMLPGLKEAALGIGDIIDTLDKRATVFDKLKYATQGFLNGLGMNGGLREAINDIGDLLLGPADGSASADALGRIFAKFKGWGEDIKAFGDAVSDGIAKFEKAFKLKPGTISDTLGELAGWGFTLGAASIGISMAAAAVMSLGRAIMFLSGASLLIGGAKGLAKLFGAVSAGTAATTVANGARAAGAASTATGGMSIGAKLSGVLGVVTGLYEAVKNSTPEGMKDNVNGARSFADSVTRFFMGDKIADQSFAAKPVEGAALENEHGFAKLLRIMENNGIRAAASRPQDPGGYDMAGRQAFANSPAGQAADAVARASAPAPVVIDAASISAMSQPSGVQQVLVTNPQAPNVTVSAPITITGVSDPKAAAASAASQLGASIKSAVEAADTD